MRVLIFASGKDTGGVAIAIKRAFDKYAPDWDVRTVRFGDNYIRYPADISYSTRTAPDVAYLFEKADVIHLMQKASQVMRFDLSRKGLVIHHHGTFFRESSQSLLTWAREQKAVGLVSTIDLLGYGPPEELTWLPSPVDVTSLQRMRLEQYVQTARPRVAHAPTSRELKGTQAFLQAMVGMNADLDLIEGVDWTTCLERKAKADIVFDQATLGYGQNALEAWGMGLPVLSGAADWRVTRRIRNTIGYLPYHPTTEKDIVHRLGELVNDQALRREVTERGWAYVLHHHNEPVVVERLKGIYEQARALR